MSFKTSISKANKGFNKIKKKKKIKSEDNILEQSDILHPKKLKDEIAELFDYDCPKEGKKKLNTKSKETSCNNLVNDTSCIPALENVKRKFKNKEPNAKQDLAEIKGISPNAVKIRGEAPKKKKIKIEDATTNFTSNYNNDSFGLSILKEEKLQKIKMDCVNMKTSLLKPPYLVQNQEIETPAVSPKMRERKTEAPKKKKIKIEDATTNFTSNYNNDSFGLSISKEEKLKKIKKDCVNMKTSLLKPSYLVQNQEIETHAVSPKMRERKTEETNKTFAFNFNNNDTSLSGNENSFKNNSNHRPISSNQSLLKPPYLQNKEFFKKDSYKNSKNEKWLKKVEQKNKYLEQKEEEVKLSEGRNYTISIAVPASILEETCLLHELRTYVIGQLARSACIYSVDEIIVYNDQCWRSSSEVEESIQEYMGMMKMILEYQECPQYLRKNFFPRHHYMSKVGVLNALNAPHHFLTHQWCDYRDGVVLNKDHGKISYVHVGLRNEVEIDRKLEPGLRVTVKFPPEARSMKRLYATVVSPEEPRKKGGLYWGYTVRVANTLLEIFKSDRFEDGYDLIIGTSDKGDSIYSSDLPSYKHSLIVFGGVEGLEAAMMADKTIKEKEPRQLFPFYLNSCPNQQSRTIRTEEAVLITLSALSEKLQKCGSKES